VKPATTKIEAPTGGRKFLIMSAPGAGKTPLATALPYGERGWSERAIYIPCDQKERGLAGTLPQYRDRLTIANYADATDPYSFVKSVIEYPDWEKDDNANTIIIDTMTNLSRDILRAATNGGHYNAKSVTFGNQTLKLSDKPHYGLAHNLMTRIVETIKASKYNILALFWSDYLEPEGGVGAFGGPLTINMNESKRIAGEFSNVIYLRTQSKGDRTEYLAHTETTGIWMARLAGVMPNPIPVVSLNADPVNFWHEVDKVQGHV
jgi:hypothetical protein